MRSKFKCKNLIIYEEKTALAAFKFRGLHAAAAAASA